MKQHAEVEYCLVHWCSLSFSYNFGSYFIPQLSNLLKRCSPEWDYYDKMPTQQQAAVAIQYCLVHWCSLSFPYNFGPFFTPQLCINLKRYSPEWDYYDKTPTQQQAAVAIQYCLVHWCSLSAAHCKHALNSCTNTEQNN